LKTVLFAGRGVSWIRDLLQNMWANFLFNECNSRQAGLMRHLTRLIR
jgi:hypothetical protein